MAQKKSADQKNGKNFMEEHMMTKKLRKRIDAQNRSLLRLTGCKNWLNKACRKNKQTSRSISPYSRNKSKMMIINGIFTIHLQEIFLDLLNLLAASVGIAPTTSCRYKFFIELVVKPRSKLQQRNNEMKS